MEPISEDSVQALALLPLDQAEEMQRGWLQNTLAWLMSVPPALRTERLRHLAARRYEGCLFLNKMTVV